MARIAVVHKERCNPVGCGGYLCIRVCPENRMGKECIVVDPVDKKIKINEEQCGPGVTIAANKCPFDAIHIINLPQELENPIHRYGQNGFALYSLPTPIFGKVVGIVGRNGIGKSTAIKILAGVLKPNFGKEKESSYEELIQYFKGTESQIFFEKLKKGEIKISYKPQQVDLIPKTTKGKVKDLLKKVDEKNEFDKVVKELALNNILDNDISTISGGELQRVAIAATVLKKASLYIFDEPTSYLDIKQRIIVSKFIKELAKEDVAVVLVEHDLIILDYMTDLVHIMYGKEACYGIVSLVKPTKAGINTFLEGFIKESNMRFREYKIKFLKRPPVSANKRMPITSWNKIEKKLDKFLLKAEQGEISKNEVVGVLGENGIGKTTFVKLLAHEISPDKGEIDEKIRVSYKPQYLESSSEELVVNILRAAIEKYEILLIRPLEIKHLLTKKLNQLSGGELQRVAIAHCLSQEADLYLLDEPSAYLDVEQRINVSKVMRDFAEQKNKSILVVDHDLLFLDYLSNALLVFDGVPAVSGEAKGPFTMEQGMNDFLKKLNITMRRDEESNRPRINKPGSVLDREQKEKEKLYYS